MAKAISHRQRRITIEELSSYFGIHRNTMRKKISAYGQLNMKDPFSVLDFAAWYARKKGKSLS